MLILYLVACSERQALVWRCILYLDVHYLLFIRLFCSYFFFIFFFLVYVCVCFSIKFCGHQLNIDPRPHIAYCSFSMTERVRVLYLVSSSNLNWVLRLVFPEHLVTPWWLSVVTLHNQYINFIYNIFTEGVTIFVVMIIKPYSYHSQKVHLHHAIGSFLWSPIAMFA